MKRKLRSDTQAEKWLGHKTKRFKQTDERTVYQVDIWVLVTQFMDVYDVVENLSLVNKSFFFTQLYKNTLLKVQEFLRRREVLWSRTLFFKDWVEQFLNHDGGCETTGRFYYYFCKDKMIKELCKENMITTDGFEVDTKKFVSMYGVCPSTHHYLAFYTKGNTTKYINASRFGYHEPFPAEFRKKYPFVDKHIDVVIGLDGSIEGYYDPPDKKLAIFKDEYKRLGAKKLAVNRCVLNSLFMLIPELDRRAVTFYYDRSHCFVTALLKILKESNNVSQDHVVAILKEHVVNTEEWQKIAQTHHKGWTFIAPWFGPRYEGAKRKEE